MSKKLKEKINAYIRVLKIMKKPTKEEFLLATKVTLLGATIIGIIGYVIYLIFIYVIKI